MWYSIAIFSFVLILGLFLYVVYKVAFGREREVTDPYMLPPGKQYAVFADEVRDNITQLLKQPYEQVYTTAWDGVTLAAKYYHRKNGAPVQLLFHGYRGNAVREFSGTFRLIQSLEMNTLVVDMRGHGLSGGKCITLGLWESKDCVSWIEYVSARFGKSTPIVLTGVSMGATSVLLAGAHPLPDNVRCIVADSPFSTSKGMVRKICQISKLPFWLGYPIANLAAAVFGGFALWKGSALKAAEEAKVPILLIHGESDYFVPETMSAEIYDHIPGKKERFTVPKAGHCLAYHIDPKGYLERLKNFFVQTGVFAQNNF